MKRTYKQLLLAAVLTAAALVSCDLERYPLTDLSEDKFWGNESNASLALTSLYRGNITNGLEYNVSDFWSYHGLLFMEHLTDNAFDRRGENNAFFNISSGKLQSTNAFVTNYWKSAYKRIGMCNRFLEGIESLSSDEATKARMTAEARFLRATQYHYLASYFKNVPLVTAKEIIDLGDNEIHSSYSELFWPGTGTQNKENIFYISYLENYFGSGFPQQILPAKDGGWSLSDPSASLFEAYEFTDGTPFSYDDPRYNPENLGENRDPRLDYTIYYNGSTFMGTEYRMSPDYEASMKERIDYSSEASKTGFLWRKYFNEAAIGNLQSYSAVTPIIRYAEVLLSYLECQVESGQGINQSLLDATINKVRGRADVNMPPITETDASKLRELIRHERKIELCFEGIRYWDLLRWGIAHEVLVGEIWGAPYPNSELYASSTKQIDPTGHCRWYVGRRDFRNPQDYTWPIPQSEQNINANLKDE